MTISKIFQYVKRNIVFYIFGFIIQLIIAILMYEVTEEKHFPFTKLFSNKFFYISIAVWILYCVGDLIAKIKEEEKKETELISKKAQQQNYEKIVQGAVENALSGDIAIAKEQVDFMSYLNNVAKGGKFDV